MMSFMMLPIIVYIFIVICFARKVIVQLESSLLKKVDQLKKRLKDLEMTKSGLYEEKISFENEATEIFTLYEITKEITKSLNEKEAFEVFSQKLKDNVGFDECRLLDPHSDAIRTLRKSDDHFVFTLKGKRKNIGYLVLRGLAHQDEEKVMILGHQCALALRRVKLYQEIEQNAITDSLTGVYTRQYTLGRLQEETKRSKTKKIPMAFLMIDVDYFKGFNDQYGHLTGDHILREIGAIILDNIREIDIAGRFGGEEFCVVLPDTNLEGALFAAERIRRATSEATIKAYDTEVNVTVSIGIATFPDVGKDVDELVDKADWALYRSKKQGRNRVSAFGVYKK